MCFHALVYPNPGVFTITKLLQTYPAGLSAVCLKRPFLKFVYDVLYRDCTIVSKPADSRPVLDFQTNCLAIARVGPNAPQTLKSWQLQAAGQFLHAAFHCLGGLNVGVLHRCRHHL
ncbi:hypothetical protein KR51_00022380 [Rubidibacter lacunae KORDI 51-2]|uniref:Uncharacterized protein n=1 Tax=Rubidibacter lacunae KORDI 51-2 TaxID=582515 RepID=U5DNA6_9CHRO|nr:hypothetical protein KR51_00022380 [Rubidibacter lacunae KORDI 51-2]